jgi:hypothetical protein
LAYAVLVWEQQYFPVFGFFLLSKHVRNAMNNAQVTHALLCFHVYGKDLNMLEAPWFLWLSS